MSGRIISTIEHKCRKCYSCIRNCPVKAIKVEEGQAKVIEERCLACGNCVKVCAQSAKAVERGVERVQRMLAAGGPVLACLAPSFPASFHDVQPGQVLSGLRLLGFQEVLDVSFGAELVAAEYRRLIARHGSRLIITTACPAVVLYVERYAHSLLPFLAPVVSPMVALGRVVKERYRPGASVVFIGPCTAKKAEIKDEQVADAIDAVLTFQELKQMLSSARVALEDLPPSGFDGPAAGVARIFPVSGGLLKSAAMQADILEEDILVTGGKDNALQILGELSTGDLRVKFLDILFCEGCIDGPVIDSSISPFARREVMTAFVKKALAEQRNGSLQGELEKYAEVSMSRTFTHLGVPRPMPDEAEIRAILRQINKMEKDDELNCGSCGYDTCREKAIAVYQGMAELEMCLPYLIDKMQRNYGELERFSRELARTQDQLIHSEKLATVGQLAAGVAHELNNPLGTILIYAHLLLKQMEKADPRQEDCQTIVTEASRCRRIVAGLLDFARQGKLILEATDMNALLRELAAELQRQPAFERVTISFALDPSLPQVMVDPAQLRRVFLNMMVNAAEAMPEGGGLTLTTGLSPDGQQLRVAFADTGCGIPEGNLGKVFTPFFTTKPIGRGTGLGLAISYGIVKMHRGGLEVSSELGKGTIFTVTLPVMAREAARGESVLGVG